MPSLSDIIEKGFEVPDMPNIKPSEHYQNVLFSEASRAVMTRGRILTPPDDAHSLIKKLHARLRSREAAFGETKTDTDAFLAKIEGYVRAGVCILGSPLLTNLSAERRTLASCSAVPMDEFDLSRGGLRAAEPYYKLNMGSGYNLDRYDNPVEMLIALNCHAAGLEAGQECERYIGNIAHVSIKHPAVLSFIAAKTKHRDLRHFNISVDLNDDFMAALDEDRRYSLADGHSVKARDIWDAITYNAWMHGDPGIISLDRFNACNSVAMCSPYTTTAPCAEVGLAGGEACIFAYINLAACLRVVDGLLDLDHDLLGDVTECLTRVLDDCLEESLNGFPTTMSNSVVASNRKIGIGVCGFADALLWLGIDYGSAESCLVLRSALTTINYRSKCASVMLSSRRGAFPRFLQSRYATDGRFLSRFASSSVGIDERAWSDLARSVERHGIRNSMTTALPPSGRVSLLLGVNASIEPLLHSSRAQLSTPEQVLARAGYVNLDGEGAPRVREMPTVSGSWPRSARTATSLFRDARDLSVAEHLSVLSAACSLVDDGVSKTVNLPSTASVTDVEEVYGGAWRAGLKAISVFRDPGMAAAAAARHELAV